MPSMWTCSIRPSFFKVCSIATCDAFMRSCHPFHWCSEAFPKKHSPAYWGDSLSMVMSRRRWGEHGRMLVAQFSEFTTWFVGQPLLQNLQLSSAGWQKTKIAAGHRVSSFRERLPTLRIVCGSMKLNRWLTDMHSLDIIEHVPPQPSHK